jgi:hypothetical protein
LVRDDQNLPLLGQISHLPDFSLAFNQEGQETDSQQNRENPKQVSSGKIKI